MLCAMPGILLLIVLCLLTSACGAPAESPVGVLVPVPTQEAHLGFGPQACPAALLEGTLVEDAETGVAVQGPDERFPPAVVVWPNGYVAADVGDTRVLMDGRGAVVARVGDHVSAGGGAYPPRDWFHTCGEITFTPAE